MNRREALKNIGYATGFFVATPTVISLMNSCTKPVATWTPGFLTPEQGQVLVKIIDVLLPKTENPSGGELNIPQFIDQYIAEVYDDQRQAKSRAGFEKVVAKLKEHSGAEIADVTEAHIKAFLDVYMLGPGDEDPETDTEAVTTAQTLSELKYMAVRAYVHNEQIGENVLAYDPVPSDYFCGDVQELTQGRAWSLGK